MVKEIINVVVKEKVILTFEVTFSVHERRGLEVETKLIAVNGNETVEYSKYSDNGDDFARDLCNDGSIACSADDYDWSKTNAEFKARERLSYTGRA